MTDVVVGYRKSSWVTEVVVGYRTSWVTEVIMGYRMSLWVTPRSCRLQEVVGDISHYGLQDVVVGDTTLL